MANAAQNPNGNPAVMQQNLAARGITAQQMFIINSFRGGIYITDQLDVQDTPLYDTLTYNHGDTINPQNSSWFTNVANNSGKSIAQTNMTENSVLGAPEAFAIFGVRLGWSEDVYLPDLYSLVNGWAYNLILGKKAYQTANIRHFSSGWGITGYTTRSSQSNFTNGHPGRESMCQIAIKLVIANQMSFSANLQGNSSNQFLSESGTGLIFTNELVGLFARGVQ